MPGIDKAQFFLISTSDQNSKKKIQNFRISSYLRSITVVEVISSSIVIFLESSKLQIWMYKYFTYF